jgi:hypothetical protein
MKNSPYIKNRQRTSVIDLGQVESVAVHEIVWQKRYYAEVSGTPDGNADRRHSSATGLLLSNGSGIGMPFARKHLCDPPGIYVVGSRKNVLGFALSPTQPNLNRVVDGQAARNRFSPH